MDECKPLSRGMHASRVVGKGGAKIHELIGKSGRAPPHSVPVLATSSTA